MNLKTKQILMAVSMVAVSASAMAAGGFDPDRLYVGAGVSRNSVSGSDDSIGHQIFGGYEFGEVAKNISIDLEVGYMDTGDMEVETVCVPGFCVTADARAKGLWATGVGRFRLNEEFDLLARAGLDFGDDDGLMLGVGGAYNLNKQVQLRAEYVERDNVNSVQFNVTYKP